LGPEKGFGPWGPSSFLLFPTSARPLLLAHAHTGANGPAHVAQATEVARARASERLGSAGRRPCLDASERACRSSPGRLLPASARGAESTGATRGVARVRPRDSGCEGRRGAWASTDAEGRGRGCSWGASPERLRNKRKWGGSRRRWCGALCATNWTEVAHGRGIWWCGVAALLAASGARESRGKGSGWRRQRRRGSSRRAARAAPAGEEGRRARVGGRRAVANRGRPRRRGGEPRGEEELGAFHRRGDEWRPVSSGAACAVMARVDAVVGGRVRGAPEQRATGGERHGVRVACGVRVGAARRVTGWPGQERAKWAGGWRGPRGKGGEGVGPRGGGPREGGSGFRPK